MKASFPCSQQIATGQYLDPTSKESTQFQSPI